MKKYFRWSGQLAILGGIYWTGNQIAAISGLPIPGSVLGVVLLFVLLFAGAIKLEHVAEVSDFLLKHLIFFFVPIAVGLMTSAEIFLENGWILVVAIIIGAAIPFFAVGTLTQMLRRRRGECKL